MSTYDIILLIIAFITSSLIASSSYKGYILIKSPTLLRLLLSFIFIAGSFLLLFMNSIGFNTFLFGIVMQAIGYFFLAFSYSIQSLGFKYMVPAIALISIALSPLFIIPGNSIEHIIRSISFVLIVYGTTNAMISYMSSKYINTLIITHGLGLLALGEFVSWYSFIYPNSIFHLISLILVVIGLILISLLTYILNRRGIKIGNV